MGFKPPILAALAVLMVLLGGFTGWAIMAVAQTASYPPPVATDLSGYATTAQIPAPCVTTPPADTLTGALGTGTPCVIRPDAARPTVIQAAVVTTDAGGNWSLTWAKAFASAAPYINAQPVNPGGSQPYICNVASSTAANAAGKCWQTVTMTLPSLATSLLGLVLNPTGAASAIQVRVAARETTQ